MSLISQEGLRLAKYAYTATRIALVRMSLISQEGLRRIWDDAVVASGDRAVRMSLISQEGLRLSTTAFLTKEVTVRMSLISQEGLRLVQSHESQEIGVLVRMSLISQEGLRLERERARLRRRARGRPNVPDQSGGIATMILNQRCLEIFRRVRMSLISQEGLRRASSRGSRGAETDVRMSLISQEGLRGASDIAHPATTALVPQGLWIRAGDLFRRRSGDPVELRSASD